MAKVIAVSDSGYEILCKLADELVNIKPQGGKKIVALDMQPYNDRQLLKLRKCLQETITISH